MLDVLPSRIFEFSGEGRRLVDVLPLPRSGFLVAAYVITALMSPLLGGSFVEKVQRHGPGTLAD